MSETAVKKFIIRRADADDIATVGRVHVESWQKSFVGIVSQSYLGGLSVEKRVKSFRKRFDADENYYIFVAEHETGEIVGFADFGKGREEKFGESEIYAFYLLKEFQRTGIGGELFKTITEELKMLNFKTMYVEALEIIPYKRFYDKMQGKIIATKEHLFDEKPVQTVIYSWELFNNYE